LESVKRPLAKGGGVAAHALDLFNADFASVDEVEQLLDAWASQAPAPSASEVMPLMPLVPQLERASLDVQIWQLLKKHALLNLRDPLLGIARIVTTVTMMSLIFIYGLDARYRQQRDVLYNFYLILFGYFCPGMMAIHQVITNSLLWLKVKREINDGMYGAFAYWAVFSLISAIVVGCLALCLLVPSYSLADWSARTIGDFVLLTMIMLANLDAMAEVCYFDGRELGSVSFLGLLTVITLGSGAFVSGDQLIWPIRLSWHVSFAHWYITAVSNVIFTGSEDFHGAVLATDGSALGNATLDRGHEFYCAEAEQNMCYGVTGSQILRSLHALYGVVNIDVKHSEAIGWMCLCWGVFKVIGMVRIFVATMPKKSQRIAAPAMRIATESSKLLADASYAS